jgi:hypothetical protein
MHKQAGYQSTQTDGLFIAILHGTAVLIHEVRDKRRGHATITFSCGGWHTRSSCKAINGALKELSIDNYHARLIKGRMVIEQIDQGLQFPMGEKVVVNL